MLTDIIRRGYIILENTDERLRYKEYTNWAQQNKKLMAKLGNGQFAVANYGPNHFPRPLRDRLRGMGTNDPSVTERVVESRTAIFFFNDDVALADRESFAKALLGVVNYFMDFEYEEAYENALALRQDGQELAADW